MIGQGSKDGTGADDNDQPYRFGFRPRAIAPWPFTERQYARLLILRSRIPDRELLQARGGDFLSTSPED